jgi:hypothetical protein
VGRATWSGFLTRVCEAVDTFFFYQNKFYRYFLL